MTRSGWFRVLLVVAVIAVVVTAVVGLSYDADRNDEAQQSSSEYVPPSIGGPMAVFLGDSYVSGAGASDPGKRWTSLVAADQFWSETNLGIGGSGYGLAAPGCGSAQCGSFRDVVNDAVALSPPIVVVGGGTNDFADFVRDPAPTVEAIYTTFGNLRAGLPRARIIAVGPSSAGVVPPFALAYEGVVRDAVEAIGGQFVSLQDPDVVNEGMLAPDGVHVNDEGHAAIAGAVEGALGGGG